MKRLDGRDVAGFIQERHARMVRGLAVEPRLAIVRQGATPATDMYLRVKRQYGEALGLPVDIYTEAAGAVLARIQHLGADPAVTGINVELPFADDPSLTAAALAAVPLDKDIEGLAPGSAFEVVTSKAIMWLLAAYNINLAARPIVVVGQGRLVGAPLAAALEASGYQVVRADEHTPDLAAVVRAAEVIISATGQPGLITSEMVAEGAVVVDAGAPRPDIEAALLGRPDLTVSPNPGGVGPMTVAALYDNLLIAAERQASAT